MYNLDMQTFKYSAETNNFVSQGSVQTETEEEAIELIKRMYKDRGFDVKNVKILSDLEE